MKTLPLTVMLVLAVSFPMGSRSAGSTETRTASLRARFEAIAGEARGRVGVAAALLETSQTVELDGNGRFPMQSVYKLPIAVAVLQRMDEAGIPLSRRVRVEPADYVGPNQHSPLRDANPSGTDTTVGELLRLMVSESDGSACDVLLRGIGGPASAAQTLRGCGVNGLEVVSTEKELGADETAQYRNSATPRAMVRLLALLHDGKVLKPDSRALLLRLMTETETGPNRIKGLLPEDTRVAHKTGSSRTVDGVTAATNDVGIIELPDGRHLAIAVFVSDSRLSTADREGIIARNAREAWEGFAK